MAAISLEPFELQPEKCSQGTDRIYPAFLTFALTKDWWVLAYLGAFIWFGITGLRNILQSVLGGGGFRRSRLLNWNDYISWTRITDSLLFTQDSHYYSYWITW